ncbi:MAG: hypothetical protein EPO22_09815, partial [Dehalococcoidia bacterium]
MPHDAVTRLTSSSISLRPDAQVIVPVGERRLGVSRRTLLLIGFWTGLGALLAGATSSVLTSLYPRGTSGFGGKIFVGSIDALAPGKKIHNLDAKTWLVRLDAEQARHNPPLPAR